MPNLTQLGKVLGKPLGRMGLVDLLKMGANRAPKVGQVGVRALAVKQ